MSWFDDKELSLEADTIGRYSLKKKIFEIYKFFFFFLLFYQSYKNKY